MITQVVFADEPETEHPLSVSETRVYWPQDDQGAIYCLRIVENDGELQALVTSDTTDGTPYTECVWSALGREGDH